MRRWMAFLLAAVALTVLHEGTHVLVATLYGEHEAIRFGPFPEVVFTTPVEDRQGVQWAYISGASNAATLLLGYGLLLGSARLARLRSRFLKGTLFYLTLLALICDPLNLSLGPFVYGGDAEGIAVGLGVSRYALQALFLLVLLANRELIVQRLLPAYDVRVEHLLFRPLVRRRSVAGG
jgi:hypothetical protein